MSEPVTTDVTATTSTDASGEAASQAQGDSATTSNTPATPKVAPSLAEIKAARAAKAAATPAAPVDAKPNSSPMKPDEKKAEEPKTEPKTAEIDMSSEALKQIAQMAAEKRALEEKFKGVDVEGATKFQKAMELAKAGKHLAAIDMLGLDLTAANMEQLGMPPETVQTKEKDEEIAALKERLEKLEGSNATRTQAEITAAQESGKAATMEYVAANAKDFVYLSRSPKWVESALVKAKELYAVALKDGKAPTDDAGKDAFVIAALRMAEKEKAEEAKLFVGTGELRTGDKPADSKEEASSSRPAIDPNNNRGNLSTPKPATAKKLSWEELKQVRRQRATGN